MNASWLLFLVALLHQASGGGVTTLDRFVESGKTWEQFLAGVSAQREVWLKTESAVTVPLDFIERAKKVSRGLQLLVVAEDWCPDSAYSVPYVARLAQAAGIPLRVIDRAAGEPLMLAHRTSDGRTGNTHNRGIAQRSRRRRMGRTSRGTAAVVSLDVHQSRERAAILTEASLVRVGRRPHCVKRSPCPHRTDKREEIAFSFSPCSLPVSRRQKHRRRPHPIRRTRIRRSSIRRTCRTRRLQAHGPSRGTASCSARSIDKVAAAARRSSDRRTG